jgi:hypothetical protein
VQLQEAKVRPLVSRFENPDPDCVRIACPRDERRANELNRLDGIYTAQQRAGGRSAVKPPETAPRHDVPLCKQLRRRVWKSDKRDTGDERSAASREPTACIPYNGSIGNGSHATRWMLRNGGAQNTNFTAACGTRGSPADVIVPKAAGSRGARRRR